VEYSSLLKTDNLLIFRGARNATKSGIALNWNVSGTRGLGQRSQFPAREKGIRERFLCRTVVRDIFRFAPTSRPLDWRRPCECPPLDVALTASVSATDSVPQRDDAVAELVLVDQFQLQLHTIREEPFFRRRRP